MSQVKNITIEQNSAFKAVATAILLFMAVLFVATPAEAATNYTYDGEVGGWIPWWSDTAGIKSATKNIKDLDTVYPFVYEVDAAGSIIDKANLSESQWKKFFSTARKNKVEIIPTVAWFDGDAIHTILSDDDLREEQVEKIGEIVRKGKYDGINIDYEGKNSDTIDYYSKFLAELNKELGSKFLTCTVEARTPAEDLYTTVPNPLKYANDYKEIAKHCDRIELMTYDQQRADLTLNKKRQGYPYAPVADNEWVEKVVDLALEDFPESKTYLGIATYGRAWDVTVAPDWFEEYTRVATLNPPRIEELSKIYKTPIGKSAGGEAVMSYFPEDSPFKILNQLPTPAGTPVGMEAAAKALMFSNATKMETKVRFITYGDDFSASEKLKIAEEKDLAGAVLFKIDGEEDQDIWKFF